MVRLEREARAAVRRARAVARRWQGPGSGPKVSVVLAVRGAARHLPECLDSVLASTHRALEVLLVAEPGDAAAQWALEWLPRGRRVRRVQPVGEQAWLDAAVAAARGDFVCFVDADDLVPAEGFAQLVRLLTDTGADLAVGSRQTARAGAERFPPWQERLLDKHDARRLGSQTVRSCPEVLVDLTLTGKMFRRDHWGRAGLSVPGWHEGAATVAAAYLGIRDKLDPPAKLEGYGYDLSEAAKLPSDLPTAIAALEADTELADLLGPQFIATFLAYKRNELERFASWVTDWEFREYSYHL